MAMYSDESGNAGLLIIDSNGEGSAPAVTSPAGSAADTVADTAASSSGGIHRLRAAARRVLHTQALAKQGNYRWRSQTGADPGVDVRRTSEAQEGSLAECTITIYDYCSDQLAQTRGFNNFELDHYLKEKRPSWSKVRWINVEGLSFDVIRRLALEFDLHPLAVEDILHIPQRTKVDRYATNLYISVILHAVYAAEEDIDNNNSNASNTGLDSVMTDDKLAQLSLLHEHTFGQGTVQRAYLRKKFEVAVEQASIFLLQDGIVLSFFQREGRLVCESIVKRLQEEGTILRTSEDPGLLIQAILDALLVVDAFRQELLTVEQKVLKRPYAHITKDLHLLTGELNQFKRTFLPMLALVRSLREYAPVTGVSCNLSTTARTYLGDVQDHCVTINDELLDLISLCDSLINLIFNLIAAQSNVIMFILSTVSCIFLPVTFIAGVYGTNFEIFPDIHSPEGINLFWKICGIVTALVIVAFIIGGWWLGRSSNRYYERPRARKLRLRRSL